MAHLNKLAIRGIRSFDDKQISVIEFFSPVTVIVGHNGSGKTTIIECLKYATTGDQPPNTRGGAFVHDPKMANEKEVKAQVKLRFHAANGKRMLAVRNLSVTVKKTSGLTMKTLESILALADGDADRGGKRGVISTKCAEMDSEIPQLLGVSKSVLENVIFCHQEDSFWPLAEPSILKKKFDDIFEATKYTKALDAIKNLRKDRMAELKAEKERLASLAREKGHADKLKGRIAELEKDVATKEVEHGTVKQEHEALVISNKEFYERAGTFREAYRDSLNLQEQIKKLTEDYEQAHQQVNILEGTEEELDVRLKSFEDEINRYRSQRKSDESKFKELDRELSDTRDSLRTYSSMHGSLQAKAEAHEARLKERETLIRDIANKLRMRLDTAPLQHPQILKFSADLDVTRKQCLEEHGNLQTESSSLTNDYNERLAVLNRAFSSLTVQQSSMREQITTNQHTMSSLQSSLDTMDDLPRELATLQAEIAENVRKLDDARQKMIASKFESKMTEKITTIRSLNDQKDNLNAEFVSLSSQASGRAKLEIKRQEVKSKSTEMKAIMDSAGPKFRKVTGGAIQKSSMEKDLDHIHRVKEEEKHDLQSSSSSADRAVQTIESALSTLRVRLKGKHDELKDCRAKLKIGLNGEGDDLKDAIRVANLEVADRRRALGELSGTGEIYVKFLANGKKSHTCPVCTQSLKQATVMTAFEKNMKEEQRKRSKEVIDVEKQDLDEWSEEFERLQALLPLQNDIDRAEQVDIPTIEKEIREKESQLPELQETADKAAETLIAVEAELKDILSLKTHSSTITRFHREIEVATNEISSLEAQLSATGSTKTVDDVQAEIDELTTRIRTAEREKMALERQRDDAQAKTRVLENEISNLTMQEVHKQHSVEEKSRSETRLKELLDSNASASTKLKELATHIKDAEAPIMKLKEEHTTQKKEVEERIAEVSRKLQQLNQWFDQLKSLSRPIESYVKDKIANKLRECVEQIAQKEADFSDLNEKVETTRQRIVMIDKEINSGGSTLANIRENQRLLRLQKDIKVKEDRLKELDVEEIVKAKRTFDNQYEQLKEKEEQLQKQGAFVLGGLNSVRNQLQQINIDMREFKDIYKRYTDQLVKVKMSDMANSDLEKYAKALDNAIMKYHTLKMGELNDTMKHLWNKTYQGTDIDGIKIRSDVEGGASKRSYNYRVVMTKDQVEMDMRGRCSAGQKMLASIIIRLALSDSFGQNCGILALDEPTNALDTENIDALASSLVDIINERKNHSNFQLIIITHDENFLRKLGHNDVMEHYWRISRDARQKSVIERQRFR